MSANRILIVEDNSEIAQTVALNLRYAGYEYMIFDDGRKAAEHLTEDHCFDLALLDIMLPGMDGFELFSYIEIYNIPVIYIQFAFNPKFFSLLRLFAAKFVL